VRAGGVLVCVFLGGTGARLTHGLVISPSEWSVGSRDCRSDLEFLVGLWEWDSAEGSIVGEIAEGFEFFH